MSGILPPPFRDHLEGPNGPYEPMELHFIDCIDGWDIDPDDGQKKPRRLMASQPCVCEAIKERLRVPFVRL